MKDPFKPKIHFQEAIRQLREGKAIHLSGIYEVIKEKRTGESGEYTVEIKLPRPIWAITNEIAPILVKNKSLKVLDLASQEGLNNFCFCELLTALIQRRQILEVLNLSCNPFTPAGNEYSKQELDCMSQLIGLIPVRELNLSDCKIGNTVLLKTLLQGLINNRYVRRLDLSRNQLRNGGVICVAEKFIMKENKSLDELTLQSGLQSLNVSHNGHGNKAAEYILRALERNWNIQQIKLARSTHNPVRQLGLNISINKLTDRNLKTKNVPPGAIYVIYFLLEVWHQPTLRSFTTPLLSLVLTYACEDLKFLDASGLETVVDYAFRYDVNLTLMLVKETESIENIVAKHKFQKPILFNQQGRFSILGLSTKGTWQLTHDLNPAPLSEFKFFKYPVTIPSRNISNRALSEINKHHLHQPMPLVDLKALVEFFIKKGFFKTVQEAKSKNPFRSMSVFTKTIS